jgi:glycosyltransferase involved in cell wall biosynthesis
VPITQLKTRLLEGSLFGAVVASDSPLYAQDYFADGKEFISYSSPQDLKAKLTELLADDTALADMRTNARAKAESLRVTNLWSKLDAALNARGLARLPLATAN